MNRRSFVRTIGFAALAASVPTFAKPKLKSRELHITRILIQEARGRRITPVAPNAYAVYRGYDVTEPILRIQTAQGLEGIARANTPPNILKELLGRDPFKFFQWDNDRVKNSTDELLRRLGPADIALLDLLGKALNRPVADLLGKRVRKSVPIYDSSLYMEDLLKPNERENLAYIKGPIPSDPIELVAQKAKWVVHDRPEGFRAVKVKLGRVKWMQSFEAALARDIAVTLAIREAIGPKAKLCVDGNKGYQTRPDAVAEYAAATAKANVYFLEEMFAETDITAMQELKSKLRAVQNPVKLAAGESFSGGIPEKVFTQRFKNEPLIDIEQADMNATGFLRLREKAAIQQKLGMTIAPHNFGSKLGFYAQIHIGMVTPNFEIAETDDSQFPAIIPEGYQIKNGQAKLNGAPGLGLHLNESALGKITFEANL